MPAEAIRLRRRLGARDRLFIAILVAAALIGTIAAVVAARGGGDSAAVGRTGCISITRASWMGSATLSYCGADAVAYCSKTRIGQFAAGHPESIERCRAAGILPPAG
ncbi:MAG: hypothetical protein QOI71_1622 [Gaiellales bacterium]|nr:hypothetical protein [Gaiellales bacterium]